MKTRAKATPPGKRLKPAQISKLDTYRPLALTPKTWVSLLRDDHPVGNILDFGRV